MTAPSAIIQAWQQKLLDAAVRDGVPNPLPKYGADGLGGAESQAAVIDFQRRHNLPVSGQLDEATRAALDPHPVQPISPAEIAILSAVLSSLPFVPQPVKDTLIMFPTLLQLAISILPGIPDDISKIEAELKELASTESGVAKIRSAIAFGRAMLNEAEKVVNGVDPQGAVAASTPVPAAVAASASTK